MIWNDSPACKKDDMVFDSMIFFSTFVKLNVCHILFSLRFKPESVERAPTIIKRDNRMGNSRQLMKCSHGKNSFDGLDLGTFNYNRLRFFLVHVRVIYRKVKKHRL